MSLDESRSCLAYTKCQRLSVLFTFFVIRFDELKLFRCLGKERTLAMIKPDGVSGNYTEEIKRLIVEAGFNIVKERLTQLEKEAASAFYDEHSSRSFFPDLVSYMTR